MALSARVRMTAPSFRLASAISMVGSSRKRPLAMKRSASVSVTATDGAGLKVCELVPSGTTPSSRMRVPPHVLRKAGYRRYCGDHSELLPVRGFSFRRAGRGQRQHGKREYGCRCCPSADGPAQHGLARQECRPRYAELHSAHCPPIAKCSRSGSNPNSFTRRSLSSSR